MTKNSKGLIFASIALVFAFVASYVNFSTYKPKTIKQVQEVKGLQTSRTDGTTTLPLPQGAEKIGINRASDAEQLTFHTNKSKQEIQDFYKNIFVSSKWTLDSQGTHTDFIVARYKKENKTINVITLDANGEFKTLVSLETIN